MLITTSDLPENVIPISIAFLVALFIIQPLGTHLIARAFAPICLVWFLLLAGIGIANLSLYPGILRALDPSRAIMYFVRTQNFDALSGIILAITGCEGIFANLGQVSTGLTSAEFVVPLSHEFNQFDPVSIRIGFGLVYTAIVLNYLGQGAKLVVDPSTIENCFFRSIPGPVGGPLYWITFVASILATLVASQSLITATFSLVQQRESSGRCPPTRDDAHLWNRKSSICAPFLDFG